MKVLILGATGMLGYSLFSNLYEDKTLSVFGTARSLKGKEHFFKNQLHHIYQDVDVTDTKAIQDLIKLIDPDTVINCIGVIKQHQMAKQHLTCIELNALLPHQLAAICDEQNARLIHFSTDCVFDGKQGLYKEQDLPNSTDLYGQSKRLGEVDYGEHLTLRTSIIGHELASSSSLVDWFLSQEGEVKGFSRAIFSGLPTHYIAKLLAERILKNPNIKGLYHLSAQPIDKFSLLSLVAKVYKKQISVLNHPDFVIDRSLESTPLRQLIDWTPPTWPSLIDSMHQDYLKRYVQ